MNSSTSPCCRQQFLTLSAGGDWEFMTAPPICGRLDTDADSGGRVILWRDAFNPELRRRSVQFETSWPLLRISQPGFQPRPKA